MSAHWSKSRRAQLAVLHFLSPLRGLVSDAERRMQANGGGRVQPKSWAVVTGIERQWGEMTAPMHRGMDVRKLKQVMREAGQAFERMAAVWGQGNVPLLGYLSCVLALLADVAERIPSDGKRAKWNDLEGRVYTLYGHLEKVVPEDPDVEREAGALAERILDIWR